ncbi:MAG: hypothetical protein CMJ97_00805 [Planctomycetes bacterium]|nr:hypothetical protein [Planctomycetota bacterium]
MLLLRDRLRGLALLRGRIIWFFVRHLKTLKEKEQNQSSPTVSMINPATDQPGKKIALHTACEGLIGQTT